MKDLSEYTDKELRQELYRRSKKNKISERDKKKCFNCKNRIPYTKAKIMARKGILPFKYSSFWSWSNMSKMQRHEWLSFASF
jgi:hypothetical protein